MTKSENKSVSSVSAGNYCGQRGELPNFEAEASVIRSCIRKIQHLDGGAARRRVLGYIASAVESMSQEQQELGIE